MRALILIAALGCATAPKGPNPAEPRLASMLAEVIRFPTVAGNDQARKDQQAWLLKTAAALGFVARDAGPVTEIELPGPPGAPVLGLVVHGDVQPVDAAQWTVPPFEGLVKDGEVIGRGAADDKGPLVQALLAMEALKGEKLTHTVRLLVGSDEESGSSDMKTYLASHAPPDYSLVLDSDFPAVVGEKAWDGLAVFPSSEVCGGLVEIDAGLAPSIVPDRARVTVHALPPPKLARIKGTQTAPGTRLEVIERGDLLDIIVHGKAAHAGVNLAGGRNALVSLAHVLHGSMPNCPVADLFDFIGQQDTEGRALGLTDKAAPGWGGWAVNVATLRKEPRLGNKLALVINLRRPPPMTAQQSQEYLFAQVRNFSRYLTPGVFFFGDEPLVFDPNAKLVKRLMADFHDATGESPAPAISGGGTYAKRIPNAIAYGMWFRPKPYPGHDVDEKIAVADLQRGLNVLFLTVHDLATGAPIKDPLKP